MRRMGWEEFGVLSQVALAVAATMASIISVQVARRLATHEFHQASLAILQDLTTGEVAEARDVLGTFMYGGEDAVRALSRTEVIRAFYTVSWCLERVARGYAAMDISRSDKIRDAFCRSVKWHSTELVTNLALVRQVLHMDDQDAWRALKDATDLLSKRPQFLSVEVIDDQRAAALTSKRGLESRVASLQ
jgi:hypothetical protein